MMKLGEIAERLGARLRGAADIQIHAVRGIEEAGPGDLTFVSNPKYAPAAKTTRASAVIVAEDFPEIAAATLRSKNPYLAFAKAVQLFYEPPKYPAGVHRTAIIDASAKIGRNAYIGPYAVVERDVTIGDDCVLLAHVVIYQGARIGKNFFAHAHAVVREFCEIGNNVILQNGVVVGGDGFGFAKDDEGIWRKIVQSGRAILEDGVEVQANACVDRASIGETRIEAGTKIDNLAQVGHGSRVGRNALLCAQAGLAGSSHIGNNVILAGQAGVAGHCKIGDNVIVTAQSGTHGDIPAGKIMSGSPAIENQQWLRCVTVYNRLPELARAIRARGKMAKDKSAAHE